MSIWPVGRHFSLFGEWVKLHGDLPSKFQVETGIRGEQRVPIHVPDGARFAASKRKRVPRHGMWRRNWHMKSDLLIITVRIEIFPK